MFFYCRVLFERRVIDYFCSLKMKKTSWVSSSSSSCVVTWGIILMILSLLSDVVAAGNLRDPQTTVHKHDIHNDDDPHRTTTQTAGNGCASHSIDECLGQTTIHGGTTKKCCKCSKVVPFQKTECIVDVPLFVDTCNISEGCNEE